MAFTPAQLWECAEREVAIRRHVYAKRVRENKMSQDSADLEIEMMVEIARILRDRAQGRLDL